MGDGSYRFGRKRYVGLGGKVVFCYAISKPVNFIIFLILYSKVAIIIDMSDSCFPRKFNKV